MKTKKEAEHLLRREGFWHSGKRSQLPKPVPREKPWVGKGQFVTALKRLEGYVRKTNPPQMCKGSSKCRCCGEKNGSFTYRHAGWAWPSGFLHYVEKHNVRPSLSFQEFVIGELLE